MTVCLFWWHENKKMSERKKKFFMCFWFKDNISMQLVDKILMQIFGKENESHGIV